MLAAKLYMLVFAVVPTASYTDAIDVARSIETSVSDVADVDLRTEIATDEVLWSYCESRWRPDVVSPTGDIGVMQTQARWLTVPVAEVRASRLVGYQQALPIVLDGYARCGSREGAWSYYAGGSCSARKGLVWRRLFGGGC